MDNCWLPARGIQNPEALGCTDNQGWEHGYVYRLRDGTYVATWYDGELVAVAKSSAEAQLAFEDAFFDFEQMHGEE